MSSINKLIVIERDKNLGKEIYKQNSLIECSFKELETWNEIHHDLVNELIAIFQQIDYRGNLFKEEFKKKIFVRRKTLERNSNFKRRTNKEIFDFFKKIRDTSFTIKGIDQRTGYKTTEAIAFLDYVKMHEEVGKDTYFELDYTELFALLCQKEYSLNYGNYSKINLLQTTQLNSKYAKALLEMLEANKYKKQFTLKEQELKSYLKYDVKHYYFSGLIKEINKVYNSVNSHINFTYTPHKSEKSITFKI